MVRAREAGVTSRCMKKTFLLLSLIATLVAGCATSPQHMAMGDKRSAVMCQSCGWMWVGAPNPGGKPGVCPMSRMHWKQPCPMCAKMAKNYLSAGKMQGMCNKCGKPLNTCIVEVKPQPAKKSY